MKTPEEIRNLTEAFRTVTKEINKAIDLKDESDRICIAMMMLPLMPAIDEFMKVLKEDVKEESSPEDTLNNLSCQIKINESIS